MTLRRILGHTNSFEKKNNEKQDVLLVISCHLIELENANGGYSSYGVHTESIHGSEPVPVNQVFLPSLGDQLVLVLEPVDSRRQN